MYELAPQLWVSVLERLLTVTHDRFKWDFCSCKEGDWKVSFELECLPGFFVLFNILIRLAATYSNGYLCLWNWQREGQFQNIEIHVFAVFSFSVYNTKSRVFTGCQDRKKTRVFSKDLYNTGKKGEVSIIF